jgi:hypothetical protein
MTRMYATPGDRERDTAAAPRDESIHHWLFVERRDEAVADRALAAV